MRTPPDAPEPSRIDAELDGGRVRITVRNAVTGGRSTKKAVANKSEGTVSRNSNDGGVRWSSSLARRRAVASRV